VTSQIDAVSFSALVARKLIPVIAALMLLGNDAVADESLFSN